jgi:hypothetical protein
MLKRIFEVKNYIAGTEKTKGFTFFEWSDESEGNLPQPGVFSSQ